MFYLLCSQMLVFLMVTMVTNQIHLKDYENEAVDKVTRKHTKKTSSATTSVKLFPFLTGAKFNDGSIPSTFATDTKLNNAILSAPTVTKQSASSDVPLSGSHANIPLQVSLVTSILSSGLHANNSDLGVTAASQLLGPMHGFHWELEEHRVAVPHAVQGGRSLEGTFLWAVGLFGTVENTAVVLTLLSSRRLRRPLHALIGTLSGVDLIITLVYIPSYTYFLLENPGVPEDEITKVSPPMTSSQRAFQQSDNDSGRSEVFPLNWSYCVLSRYVFIELASVTLTVKALIAVYLYVLTTSREKATKLFSFPLTCIYISAAWMINFLVLFVPHLLGYPRTDFYPRAYTCYPGQAEQEAATRGYTAGLVSSLAALSLHMLELCITGFCFSKVHHAIRCGRHLTTQHKLDDKATTRRYQRASRTTFLVFLSFLLCWLPIYFLNVLDPSHQLLPQPVYHIAMDLLLLKSSLNPLIYIYGVRSLRHRIKMFCLCRTCQQQPDQMGQVPSSALFYGEGESNSTERI